jgi:hypothetical protein
MMVVREASKRSAQSSSTFGKHRTVQRPEAHLPHQLRRQGKAQWRKISEQAAEWARPFGSIAPHTGLHSGERAWRNVNPYHSHPSPRNSQCKGQHSSAPVNGETAAHWGALASNREHR